MTIQGNQAADVAPFASAGAPVAVALAPAATVVPLDRRPVAVCGRCGRPYSAAAYQALPLGARGGEMAGALEGTTLQLRCCLCGSHIAATVRDGAYLLYSEYLRLAAADDSRAA